MVCRTILFWEFGVGIMNMFLFEMVFSASPLVVWQNVLFENGLSANFAVRIWVKMGNICTYNEYLLFEMVVLQHWDVLGNIIYLFFCPTAIFVIIGGKIFKINRTLTPPKRGVQKYLPKWDPAGGTFALPPSGGGGRWKTVQKPWVVLFFLWFGDGDSIHFSNRR